MKVSVYHKKEKIETKDLCNRTKHLNLTRDLSLIIIRRPNRTKHPNPIGIPNLITIRRPNRTGNPNLIIIRRSRKAGN